MESESILQWCQGEVTEVTRDKSERYQCLVVKVTWKDEFVEPGKSNTTREKLKKYPDEHPKSWWEELYHLILTSECN